MQITEFEGALCRTEEAIGILRSSYVCKNWKLDEARAARTLAYMRRLAAGRKENQVKWAAALAFLSDHDLSLDWIFRGNPGGMICGLASQSPANRGRD